MLQVMASAMAVTMEVLQERLAKAGSTEDRLQALYDMSDFLCSSAPKEAERYTRQLLDEARAAQAFSFIGTALNDLAYSRLFDGDFVQVFSLCNECLTLAREHDLPRAEGSANNVLGLAFFQRGDIPQAIEHHETCLRISREISWPGGISTALGNLACCHHAQGRMEKALEYYQESLQLDLAMERWLPVGTSLENIGKCYEQLGDWEKALEYFYRSIALAEQHDLKSVMSETLLSLAALFSKRGRIDRGLELYDRAARLAEANGLEYLRARIYGSLAEAHLARGDVLAAGGMLERCRDVAQRLEDQEEIARYHRRMSETILAAGGDRDALSEIELALNLAMAMGCRIEHGICRRVLGRVQERLGAAEPAHLAFERAIAVLSGQDTSGPVRADATAAAETGPGFGYELALAHFAYARFLAAQHDENLAAEHAQQAAELFVKLSIMHSAEEVNRFLFSLRSASARVDDTWLSILHSFSNITTWPAPVSEFAAASLALLSQGLGYQGGALFFYAQQPYTVGRIQLQSVLALPRQRTLVLQPDAVQIPVNLYGRDVGMLYLCDPVNPQLVPDRSFWEIIASMLALTVERIRARTKAPTDLPDPQSARRAHRAGSATPAGAAATDGTQPMLISPVLSGSEPPSPLRFGSIVASSPAMTVLLDTVERVAPTTAGVLLRGESGTGKEVVARAIHDLSPRHNQPLVIINCAALPETLLEAELFGIEKGAATGVHARIGRLQQADRGTVFLDEIGDMSLPLQAKLLRVLQDRTLEPVGGSRAITVDVRFIAATNKDLEAAVAAGTFRNDLYHRLDVISLTLPPLRERREELPRFIQHFIRKYSEEFMRPIQAMTGEALGLLLTYDWPGNVRELENVIERAVIVARDGVISPADLPAALQHREPASPTAENEGLKARKRAVRQKAAAPIEKEFILRMLQKHDWRVPTVLSEMGISRSHFYRLLDKHGIRRAGGGDGGGR
jgi:DNA-binding NtrC family response regulator/tetratricopeptide (TPR) repeat protein